MPSSPSRTSPTRATPDGSDPRRDKSPIGFQDPAVRTFSARSIRAAASRPRRSWLPSLSDEVLLDESRERGLRCSTARPDDSGRERRDESRASPALQDDGAKDGALGQRQPLPDGLEDRLLLGQEPRERDVQRIERRASSTRRPHVVPRFMREPLDVVRKVAGEVDDRRARARLRRGCRSSRTWSSMKCGEDVGAESSAGASPVRPCRTAAAVRSSFPSGSARSRRTRSRPGAAAARPRAGRVRRSRR